MTSLPKFDSRAKNALAIAQQIAIQLGHNHIGSEHLLFGVLSQPQEGLPFQVSFMDNLSNEELLEMIRKQGFEKFQNSKTSSINKDAETNSLLPEITEELQKCLDSAILVAEKHNYNYIGIEHLIYGVLNTNNSHGQTLMNLNEDSSKKLIDVLNSLFKSYNKGYSSDSTATGKKKTKTKRSKDSALEFFTTNINTKISSEPKFNVIKRDNEVKRIIQILSRKNKNNPIILGEPGVGKTALVEGLAKKINEGKVPEWLQDKKILGLDVGNLIAGSVFRGEFEQRIKAILDEIIERKNVILFIDELHTTIGAGGGGNSSGPDLSNILKPALARGEISIIGATTEDEYRQVIKKDKAFERRFQPIRLEEPSQSETVEIIRGIKSMYENYHNSEFPEELLTDLTELSDRFLPERRLPDKAIDILDECLVRARIKSNEKSNKKHDKNSWENVEKQIINLIQQKNEAILNNNFELSEKFEKDQKSLEQELAKLNVKNKEAKKSSIVTRSLLERVISEISGVPMVRISSNIFTQINNLQEVLDTQIFGQKEATTQITKALKRAYAGVNPNTGPISSFLLLGPTGVGKTELVKVLTRELYGDPSKYLLKLDMSEFREKHNISRLLGAPAGYVGYEDAPQLTEFLRKKPYSVILFDEIEKGHPENLNILLQMLEEGKITDAKGNTVSCEHALIFLTSNLGKNQLNRFASKLGFSTLTKEKEENYESIKEQVMEVVTQKIKPEILGRISSKIVFRPIDKDILTMIIQKELGILQNHLLKQGKTASFTKKSVQKLVENAGSNFEYGAREVKTFLSSTVQNELAEFILENPRVRYIQVDYKDKIIISKKSK